MTSWMISECYNMYVRNLLVRFLCIKDIYLSCSIYANNNDILCPLLFVIYNPSECPPQFIVKYNYLQRSICQNYNYNWCWFSYLSQRFLHRIWFKHHQWKLDTAATLPLKYSLLWAHNYCGQFVVAHLCQQHRGGYSQLPMLIWSIMVCYQLPSLLYTRTDWNPTSLWFCLCNHDLLLYHHFLILWNCFLLM